MPTAPTQDQEIKEKKEPSPEKNSNHQEAKDNKSKEKNDEQPFLLTFKGETALKFTAFLVYFAADIFYVIRNKKLKNFLTKRSKITSEISSEEKIGNFTIVEFVDNYYSVGVTEENFDEILEKINILNITINDVQGYVIKNINQIKISGKLDNSRIMGEEATTLEEYNECVKTFGKTAFKTYAGIIFIIDVIIAIFFALILKTKDRKGFLKRLLSVFIKKIQNFLFCIDISLGSLCFWRLGF